MTLKRAKQKTAVEKVIKRFVELASEIPEVQLVLYEEESTGTRSIVTIIDAPRFEDSYWYKVFEAERVALEGVSETPVEFHVSNAREANQSLDYYVRDDHRVLFRRGAIP